MDLTVYIVYFTFTFQTYSTAEALNSFSRALNMLNVFLLECQIFIPAQIPQISWKKTSVIKPFWERTPVYFNSSAQILRLIPLCCTDHSEVNMHWWWRLFSRSIFTSISLLLLLLLLLSDLVPAVGLLSLHSVCLLTWSDKHDICRMIKPDHNWWIFIIFSPVAAVRGHRENLNVVLNRWR